MRAMRWGDNDRYWGPFTYAVDPKYSRYGISLKSDSDVREDRPARASLRVSFGKRTLITVLPPIVRPWKRKVYPNWDAATVERLGRNWYWDAHPREFGFSCSDGFLSVRYGRSTMDSSTDQHWGYFLPWRQWRHVRHSLYDLQGHHNWTEQQRPNLSNWEEWRAAKDACPSATFEFLDFDGEKLSAETRIEEREWRFGTGWWKWLSLFRKPKVSRDLDIQFSGETGNRKGSWKGGTVGHSIGMLPGELHLAAFRRYCQEHDMTFVGHAEQLNTIERPEGS